MGELKRRNDRTVRLIPPTVAADISLYRGFLDSVHRLEVNLDSVAAEPGAEPRDWAFTDQIAASLEGLSRTLASDPATADALAVCTADLFLVLAAHHRLQTGESEGVRQLVESHAAIVVPALRCGERADADSDSDTDSDADPDSDAESDGDAAGVTEPTSAETVMTNLESRVASLVAVSPLRPALLRPLLQRVDQVSVGPGHAAPRPGDEVDCRRRQHPSITRSHSTLYLSNRIHPSQMGASPAFLQALLQVRGIADGQDWAVPQLVAIVTDLCVPLSRRSHPVGINATLASCQPIPHLKTASTAINATLASCLPIPHREHRPHRLHRVFCVHRVRRRSPDSSEHAVPGIVANLTASIKPGPAAARVVPELTGRYQALLLGRLTPRDVRHHGRAQPLAEARSPIPSVITNPPITP